MTVEWVETTAKTLDEATSQALDQLGVAEADAEVQVLEEPTTGLFGRTRGTARVRARVAPSAPRPKNERRRRRGRDGEGDGDGAGRSSSNGGGRSRGSGRDSRSERSGSDEPESDKPRSDKPRSDKPRSDKPRSDKGESGGGGRGSRDSRRSADAGSGGRNRTENGSPTAAAGGANPEEREMMPEAEQRTAGEEFLVGLVQAFGLDATVESNLDEEGILSFDVVGEGLGLLVGPGLGTLDAVQEVCRNAIQRQAAGREYGKVSLDVAGARAQRRVALAEFTRTEAQRVLDDGEEVVFEPMGRGDRKVIHDVVGEFEGLATESIGEDPRRRVVLRRA